MSGLLEGVTRAIDGAPLEALAAAAALGAVSVVMSPCHLAGIPLVVGVVQRQRTAGQGAATAASLFGLGVLASFVVVGGATLALGLVAGDLGLVGYLLGAALLITFGLQLLDVIDLPWFRPLTSRARGGVLQPLVVGFLFGASLGPCTFSFMAPVLGVAAAVSAAAPLQAAALVATFALAHTGVVVLAGVFGGVTERLLDSRGATRAVAFFRRATGVLLILGGLYFLYSSA